MLHLIDKIATQAHGKEAVSLGSHNINLSASHNTLELLHSGTQFNIFLFQGLDSFPEYVGIQRRSCGI